MAIRKPRRRPGRPPAPYNNPLEHIFGAAAPPRPKARPPMPNLNAWLKEVSPDWNWDWPYLLKIQEALEEITAGTLKRLMIFCPPRHGKSSLTTIRYPVYRLERDPKTRVIVTGYSQTFAEEELSLPARAVARTRPAIAIAKDKNTARYWKTREGGGIRAAGVGSPPTGGGADLIICDDPIKDALQAESPTFRHRLLEWYKKAIYTRLEPGGAIIIINTRWHIADICGQILESEDGPNWRVIRFPALAETDDPLGRAPGQALCPARFPEATLETTKKVEGSHAFASLYQQLPRLVEGSLYKREWFNRATYRDQGNAYLLYGGRVRLKEHCWTFGFCDPAGGITADADRTAVGFFAVTSHGELLVLSMHADRVAFELIPQHLLDLCLAHRADFLGVESGYLQNAMIRSARLLPGMPPVKSCPAANKGSKLAHAFPAMIACENGQVFLPEHDPAWKEDFLEEVLSFTGQEGKLCDQADVLSWAVAMQRNYSSSADDLLILGDPRNTVFR